MWGVINGSTQLQLRPAGGPTEPLRALAQDAPQQLAAGRRRDRVDELHAAGEVLVGYFVRGDVLCVFER